MFHIYRKYWIQKIKIKKIGTPEKTIDVRIHSRSRHLICSLRDYPSYPNLEQGTRTPEELRGGVQRDPKRCQVSWVKLLVTRRTKTKFYEGYTLSLRGGLSEWNETHSTRPHHSVTTSVSDVYHKSDPWEQKWTKETSKGEPYLTRKFFLCIGETPLIFGERQLVLSLHPSSSHF